MSLEASKFRLGLFFSLGTILFLVVMIWLTGWFRNADTRLYVCYFSESVQGLESGSQVRYRGVPVGTVKSVSVAPDGRLVEVVMEIDSHFPVRADIAARLELIGITGLKAINLRLSAPGDMVMQPHDFDVRYEEIPVLPSSMETLEIGLERIVEIINQVDVEQMSDQTVRLLESLNEIMDSDSISMLVSTISLTASRIDTMAIVYTRLGRDLDEIALRAGRSFPDMTQDLHSLTVQLNDLLAVVQPMTDGLDEIMAQSYSLVDALRMLVDRTRDHPGEMLLQQGEVDWP